MLEKILKEIEKRAAMVKNIPTSDEEGVEFPDGEQCYEDGRLQGRFEELLRVKELIRSHMEDDEWIPVEEKLPEYRKTCLVTVRYSGCCGMHGHWIKTGHLESDGKWWGDCIWGIVIAWKPLPEPYRPKEEK